MKTPGYSVHSRECEAAGVPEAKVQVLASKLARLADDAETLGLTIFGGGGRADLRKRERNQGTGGALIVAQISAGIWDGGDGGACHDRDGLLRGES